MNSFIDHIDPTSPIKFDINSAVEYQYNNLSEGDKYRVGAKLLGMNHLPCTFEQFIEDSYFLGNPQITNNGKSIFNIWKNVGKEIYPTSISTRTPYVSFGG